MTKKQLGPRVDADLAEAFEWFVKHINDGTYKGRLADEVTRALQLQLGTYYLKSEHDLSEVHPDHRELISNCVAYAEQELEPIRDQWTQEIKADVASQPTDQASPKDADDQESNLGDFPKLESDQQPEHGSSYKTPDEIRQLDREIGAMKERIRQFEAMVDDIEPTYPSERNPDGVPVANSNDDDS